ncbi:hypothetical protein [Archaeoglobus sp.]
MDVVGAEVAEVLSEIGRMIGEIGGKEHLFLVFSFNLSKNRIDAVREELTNL